MEMVKTTQWLGIVENVDDTELPLAVWIYSRNVDAWPPGKARGRLGKSPYKTSAYDGPAQGIFGFSRANAARFAIIIAGGKVQVETIA